VSTIPHRTLVSGNAYGPVLALEEPLSFSGGVDPRSGTITDRWHPQHGAIIAGRILVLPAGRGSGSGSPVLAEALRLSKGPKAILLREADGILVTGTLVARALYRTECPVVVVAAGSWEAATAAKHISVSADAQMAVLEFS
jgi:predicted aconitase with swiveling domain